jgi:hypothetical protein
MPGLYIGNKEGVRNRPDFEKPIVDEDGSPAFTVDGSVAALTAMTVAQINAVKALTAAEIAGLDFTSIQAVVPTSTGATTGTITSKGILNINTVTSGNADHIVVLPAPVPGTICVMLSLGATGWELRSSAPETVLINGGTGGAAVESAITAGMIVVAICVSATAWQGFTIAAAGTVAAITPAAA